MRKGIAILLIIIAALVAGGGVAVAFFIYNQSIIAVYEENTAILNAQIESIGSMTQVYVYRTDTVKGQEITAEMLETATIPSKMLTTDMVTDPNTIIGLYCKVDYTAGTPITKSVVMEPDITDESKLYHTVREYDVVVNMWPIGLEIGDYVDLRFMMPYGEEYIVLSHMRIDGMSEATVKFDMTEVQINLYQSAMVDYYLNSEQGAMLYFTKYVEPGVQDPANITYKVSNEIMEAMKKNSNLYATAWASVYDSKVRAQIESDLVNIPLGPEEDPPTEKELVEGDMSGISGGRGGWSSTITGGEGSYQDEEDLQEEDDSSSTGGAIW